MLSLSSAKGLQITPWTLPADCGGEIDYDYTQGVLEQYDTNMDKAVKRQEADVAGQKRVAWRP